MEKIPKIINRLETNKFHSSDMISMWMVKICDRVMFKPLEIIYKFSWNWNISNKLENVVLQTSFYKTQTSLISTYVRKSFRAVNR